MNAAVHIGDATLYLGDCLEILPTLGPVDVVVTDPPYGIAHPCAYGSRKRGRRAGRNAAGRIVWRSPEANDYPDVEGDAEPFDPGPILALDVPTALWGANYYANKLPSSGGWLVWDKKRPDTLDQATCELAWTNCVKGVRPFAHLWNGMMRESEHGESYHPTQKPVSLAAWILALPWIPSGVVLDPYMGAGWVGVACANIGRRFVGIEIEPRYFDIACDRIRRAYEQPRLPGLEPETMKQGELT